MDSYINEIYDIDLTYYDGYESFCYQNCLRILLQAMGYKYPELYINAAMTLRLEEKTGGLCLGFHDEMRGILPSLGSNLVRIYEKDDVTTIWERNKLYLSERREPFIAGVDTYYLPYASNYKKNHAKHTLIVCGYDLVEDIVYVIDWYPEWFYRGQVKMKDFLLARSSKNECDGTIYSGCPVENNWAYINRFEAYEPEELMKEFLKISVEKFYVPIVKSEGVESIMLLCRELKNDGNFDFYCLFQSVFGIVRRVNFFEEYLKIYNNYFGNFFSKRLLERVNETKDAWEVLQFLLIKNSRCQKRSNLLKIINYLEKIYQKEQQIGEELQRILGGS